MAGPFCFHKTIINGSSVVLAKWKSEVHELSLRGPGMGELVTQFENLCILFDRERTLLGNLIYSKNNQLKTSKYWQKTRQVNVRLKAVNLKTMASMLQSLHLKLTQDPPAKLNTQSPLVWPFLLHQLRSLAFICDDACHLIVLGYAEYCGMVELSHFMPISLAAMSVFARLYVFCCRILSLCSTTYDHLVSTFKLAPEALTCAEVQEWENWVGALSSTLHYTGPLQWHATLTQTSNNQRAIDELNRALLQANEASDDLGEEISTNQIPLSLLPPPTTATSMAQVPPSSIRSENAPPAMHTSIHRSESKPSSSLSKDSDRKKENDKGKTKLKEKHKHKTSTHPSPTPAANSTDATSKKKQDKSIGDLFSLMATDKQPSSSKESKRSDKEHKHKEKHKDKHGSSKADGESKKRKKESQDDAIDDLFSLLSPSKKQKH